MDRFKVGMGLTGAFVAAIFGVVGAVTAVDENTHQMSYMVREADYNAGTALQQALKLAASPDVAEEMIKNTRKFMDEKSRDFSQQCNEYLDGTMNPAAPLFRKGCSKAAFPQTEGIIRQYRVSQQIFGR